MLWFTAEAQIITWPIHPDALTAVPGAVFFSRSCRQELGTHLIDEILFGSIEADFFGFEPDFKLKIFIRGFVNFGYPLNKLFIGLFYLWSQQRFDGLPENTTTDPAVTHVLQET